MSPALRSALTCLVVGVLVGVVAYFAGVPPLLTGIVVFVVIFVFFLIQERRK